MRFSAVCFGLFLASALPAHAQISRVEGTITQSGDGDPIRANVSFQAPDSLKIELLNAQNEVTQTVVATGNQTQTFDARSKRLGVLNANIAREWFRGAGLLAGGPANFALVGATGFTADPDQGITRIRDRVLLGNDDRRAYYVASKQRVRAFPARIEIANGVRTDYDDLKNITLRAKVTLDPQKLPLRADIGSGADAVSFTYALKPRDTDFPANTFALPDAAKDAIAEDAVLRAPSAYADTTPSEAWNHGLALWRASGDSSDAFALWARAILANPRATAPRFSTLDVALSIRAPQGAARALDGLKPLLSEADFAWANTDLDDLRDDRAALLRDLKTAATTGEPDRKLALGIEQRASGDIDGARATWKELLTPATPRAIAQKAAENFALSATRAELPTLGQTIEGDGEAVLLTRALLDLRAGKTPTATFSSTPFREAFARALERAGQNDAARPIWETLETSDALSLQNEARAHLVTITARAGDASGALLLWNRWNATLLFDTQKLRAQNILFDAFQKAGKIDALRVLLLNRAGATAARDTDLRLNLAFQETFGSDEAIAGARNAGYDRYSTSPYWESKRAEAIVVQAFLLAPIDEIGFRKRTQAFKDADALLDKAIAGAPEPTFYKLQKALVQIQRATGIGGVLNPAELSNSNDAAHATLAALDQSDDPDAHVVAALGWNSFPGADDRANTIASAQRAFDSAPDDGDRKTLIFAARQASARVFESAGDLTKATGQWTALLDVSRSANDEAGLVAALLNGMERRKNPVGMAQLLVRVAGEHWALDANAALLSGTAGRVAASSLFSDITAALNELAGAPDTSNATKGAIVARAALSQARLQYASAVIAIPGAPPTADADLERATRALLPSLVSLKTLSDDTDPFWSTRARLLLLDSETLDSDARRDLLQKLAALHGGEPSVVLSLAGADPDARVKAAQTLDFDVETWRRLSLDALASGDKDGADFWSREAFEYVSSAPEANANQFQSIGFVRARVAWANGQVPTATAIYNSLASAGWNSISRVTALLALRKRLQEAGRTDEAKALDSRIASFNLDKDDTQNALSQLDSLDT